MIKKIYRDDTELLKSFNELTRNTFGFDFESWHAAGHFGDCYVPHAVTDAGKVVSNVSVNRMQFDRGGKLRNYIQLGTVMTDEAYRGQGLNREIMESVLREYGEADGIYLFGNDSVLDYYPKFGFVPCEEYEYYFSMDEADNVVPYTAEKVTLSEKAQAEAFFSFLETYLSDPEGNENDALYMSENIDLYHFWLDGAYSDCIYRLPECGAYAVGAVEGETLYLHQVFGKKHVDLKRLAGAFGGGFTEAVLGYTPVHKEGLSVRVHKEEDCTLFILGQDLNCVSREKMMFPILSHA